MSQGNDEEQTTMSVDNAVHSSRKLQCNARLTEVFALYLLGVSNISPNSISPKEYAFVSGKKKWELNKRLPVELYLTMHRAALHQRLPEVKNAPTIKKGDRHAGLRSYFADKGRVWLCLYHWGKKKRILQMIGKLCDINMEAMEQKYAAASKEKKEQKTDSAESNLTLSEFVYEDIRQVHMMSHELDSKTRQSYLNEPYLIGGHNNVIASESTQNRYAKFKEVACRDLSRSFDDNSTDNFSTLCAEENPNFHFSIPVSILMQQQRQVCPQCKRRVYLYCADCVLPLPLQVPARDDNHNNTITDNSNNNNDNNTTGVEDEKKIQTTQPSMYTQMSLPKLHLPIKIDIIRHPKEAVTVCSSIHACILAPDDVKMYEFPHIPDYKGEPDTYFLYPSPKATYLDEMDLSHVKKIIVIESRWSGNKTIYEHPSFEDLPHVKIRNRQTLYWRYQEHSREYLSTIEAIYYSVVDCFQSQAEQRSKYDGSLDDLLLLFAYNYQRIRKELQNQNKRLPRVWNKNG
ncbi:hypothetical protein RFI_06982 [Reticulomyxa filosa]|uniref:tRNA-uridine aminocarboxypropyltransferase 1 n=1 Tax=Reticulomyxa filosa TaxID=46433 RepID=X6NWD4_RETFI|nr:hypothetical protein RFI_06982 [Reticulomyxa filosa]|eukprot:ETO30139.1 hypothetical protein RFI_06982 [Reticulomyxa filosa]